MALSLDILQGRKKLCHLIASLPTDATAMEVAEKLDPLLVGEGLLPSNDSNAEYPVMPINDGVTPLMVACDKYQVKCLEYMVQMKNDSRLNATILGKPMETSSVDICGGNSALHYAAASGCKGAIDVLSLMLTKLYGDDSATRAGCLLELCLRNSHGDTPLMMAAAEGHTEFLQHWVQCFYDYSSESDVSRDDAKGLIQVVFDKTNDSGDSALLLACDRGSVATLDYLIREVGVSTTDEDLAKATETQKRLDSAWKHGASSQCRDELRLRQQKVKHCVALLTVAMERKARLSMEELLVMEEAAAAQMTSCYSMARKTVKKKKKQRKKKTGSVGGDPSDLPAPASSVDRTEESEVCDTSPVSSSIHQDVTSDTSQLNDPEESVSDTRTTISASSPMDSLLRDTYEERPDRSIDAMMDALCVDASMLLLTPHGMAMHLSPAQLEVVESVLEKQMSALDQARQIQARLRVHQCKS